MNYKKHDLSIFTRQHHANSTVGVRINKDLLYRHPMTSSVTCDVISDILLKFRYIVGKLMLKLLNSAFGSRIGPVIWQIAVGRNVPDRTHTHTHAHNHRRRAESVYIYLSRARLNILQILLSLTQCH